MLPDAVIELFQNPQDGIDADLYLATELSQGFVRGDMETMEVILDRLADLRDDNRIKLIKAIVLELKDERNHQKLLFELDEKDTGDAEAKAKLFHAIEERKPVDDLIPRMAADYKREVRTPGNGPQGWWRTEGVMRSEIHALEKNVGGDESREKLLRFYAELCNHTSAIAGL